MKWVLYIDELEVSELCEWVKEGFSEGGSSSLYVNINDLESDKEYVRYADVADDTKCRVFSDGLKHLPEGWIPMDTLSYDSNVGLRWNK